MNPRLYEINTRVWIKKFGSSLDDVPLAYYESLAELGITSVWLMGVWKTCTSIIDKCCFSNDLISGYQKSLKNWERTDVIGSPYSIDCYDVNPLIGTSEQLLRTKEKLNNLGMKLILDFIPNHFGAESLYIKSNPGVFLRANEEFLEKDSFTFYRPFNEELIFAHGRDPLFPAWTDTIQVNYFAQETREFMIDILKGITSFCDGVRCDMAMLPLNNVFYNSWIGVLNKMNFKRPANEFWGSAIEVIKKYKKDFLFIAETYWDLEWDLQQLGFDYTYDKRLTDRLGSADIGSIKAHLHADLTYQEKSLRFLENHDEQRAVVKFGKYKSLAAATVITTIPGMKLFYEGQFAGYKSRIPVQLGREPAEKGSNTIRNYYDRLLRITKNPVYDKGKWEILEPRSAGPGNYSYENFLIWQWKHDKRMHIIVINYFESTSQCRLKFPLNTSNYHIELLDLLSGQRFLRLVSEINEIGMFIELKGYQSHIFELSLDM